MAKINGTSLLVYADGVVIAAQKGCTITCSQNLIDITNKESAGYTEHTNGMLSAEVSIDGLASTTGLSGEGLFDYIISRKSLMLVVEGMDAPIVCEADVTSSSVNGPVEDATTLTGSFKVKGKLFYLKVGVNPNLMTDPDGTIPGAAYDTITVSGVSITSAINLAGNADVRSNEIDIIDTASYRVIFYLTLNSGQLPSVSFFKGGVDYRSNIVAAVAGLNVITLVATATEAVDNILYITNSAAANWSTSNIYVFAL